MAPFVNAAISLNVVFIPFLIDLLARKKFAPRHARTHAANYILLFFAGNALTLTLFAFYQAEPIGEAFFYLAGMLNWKYFLAALAIDGLAFAVFRAAKISARFELAFSWRLFIPLFLAVFFIVLSLRYNDLFADIPFEQLLFHAAFPAKGANYSMVKTLIGSPVVDTFAILAWIGIALSVKIRRGGGAVYIPVGRIKRFFPALAAAALFAGIASAVYSLDIPEYIGGRVSPPSTFYEELYIDPAGVEIAFPEKKRNLIVIFLESIETGFLKSAGGGFNEDVMPYLESLAEENINFSRTGGIGGASQLQGASWTIAGIAAQYSGLPLALPFVRWDSYGDLGESLLANAWSLGDIFKKAGYKNYFLCGSDIAFAGRDKYFSAHGDTAIYDYHYFREAGYIPEDYKVWWGFEDRKLYRFAKEKLLEMSKSPPFFTTILTVDTHPIDGYLDEEAETIYDAQYKNALWDAGKQLRDFILWLKDQAFYENTTIAVLGDHLYNGSSVFDNKELAPDKRYIVNFFINSLLNADSDKIKNRSFSSFDIFPTLIDAVGGEYGADGLALGRSLDKGGQTLLEQFGIGYVQSELSKRSNFYNGLF